MRWRHLLLSPAPTPARWAGARPHSCTPGALRQGPRFAKGRALRLRHSGWAHPGPRGHSLPCLGIPQAELPGQMPHGSLVLTADVTLPRIRALDLSLDPVHSPQPFQAPVLTRPLAHSERSLRSAWCALQGLPPAITPGLHQGAFLACPGPQGSRRLPSSVSQWPADGRSHSLAPPASHVLVPGPSAATRPTCSAPFP